MADSNVLEGQIRQAYDAYVKYLFLEETEKKSANTLYAYKNDTYQFCEYIQQSGYTSLIEITTQIMDAYMASLYDQHTYRATTIARKLAATKSFFRYLRLSGLIEHDPAEHISAPFIRRTQSRIFSMEDVQQLLNSIPVSTPIGRRDLAMLQLLFTTGMRVSELTQLNVDDIDFVQKALVCIGTDEMHRRQLILSDELLVSLRDYLDSTRSLFLPPHQKEETSLFLNHRGKRLTRQGFWLILKVYARHANCPELSPQTLRQVFALTQLQNGVGMRSLQQMLGHVHAASTQVYKRMSPQAVASSRRRSSTHH